MARCEGVPILVFTGNVYTHTDSDILARFQPMHEIRPC